MKKYVFRAQDFYYLLEAQKYRCPLTGRELTPENCTAAHRIPLRRGGEHALDNIYLIVEEAAWLKRNLTDQELLDLCVNVVDTIGDQHGLRVSRSKRTQRRQKT